MVGTQEGAGSGTQVLVRWPEAAGPGRRVGTVRAGSVGPSGNLR